MYVSVGHYIYRCARVCVQVRAWGYTNSYVSFSTSKYVLISSTTQVDIQYLIKNQECFFIV